MSAFLGPIHFWLYNKIQFQESLIDELVRVATAQGWSAVAGNDDARLEALKKAAYDFGASQHLSAATAPEAFHRLDDLLLDGMPCDQVNRVRESDDNRIAWDRTMDLHSEFWQGRGDLYYALRQSLVEGILAGTDYTMVSPADGQYEIVKKAA